MHNTKTHICIGQHNYRIDYWHCNKAQCPQFWQVMDFGLGWAVWLATHWRAQVSSTEHISAMEQRNTFLLMSNGTHFWNWATEHISAIEQHWTYYCKLSSDEQEHITSNLSYFMLHAIVAYVLVWIEEISPFWLLIALERERDTHTCAACFSDITTPVFAGSIKLLYNLTFKVICLHHNIIHFMFATSICNPSVSK